MRFRVAFKTDDPEVIRMMKAPGRSETVVRALKFYALLSRIDDRLAAIEHGMDVLLRSGVRMGKASAPEDEMREQGDGGVGQRIDNLMAKLGGR